MTDRVGVRPIVGAPLSSHRVYANYGPTGRIEIRAPNLSPFNVAGDRPSIVRFGANRQQLKITLRKRASQCSKAIALTSLPLCTRPCAALTNSHNTANWHCLHTVELRFEGEIMFYKISFSLACLGPSKSSYFAVTWLCNIIYVL